mmetsp:Transcript_24763/g.57181  ORF Transcript_24763/g.57181 Transcript_24763/m.57181 type:complete len:359 (+) Transcript_24763:71-1147(+)
MASDEEQRFEAEMAQVLKLSMFTHDCEESARMDDDVAIAWTQPTEEAELEQPASGHTCEALDAADEDECEIAKRLSMLSDEQEREAREERERQEAAEVERALQASLADQLLMLPPVEPVPLTQEEQENKDLEEAIQRSLGNVPGGAEKHVTWAAKLDDAPTRPMSQMHHAADEPPVVRWTLKVQLDAECRRVPISWPCDADNETKYMALCTAAYQDAFRLEAAMDTNVLRYFDESGDEVGLVPASVPDFLTFADKGVLKLHIRSKIAPQVEEGRLLPSAPAFECFQPEEEEDVSSSKEIILDTEVQKDVPDVEDGVEKDIVDDADSDGDWVTVEAEDVHSDHDAQESGHSDDLATSSA